MKSILFNQTAALLLGIAIQKVFPKTPLLDWGADEHNFYWEFTYAESFQESFCSLLEQKMKKFKESPLESMEMVAANAAEFFANQGQKQLSLMIREDFSNNTLLHLIKIEGLYSISEQEALEDLSELSFTLLGFEQEKKRVRVFGAAFSGEKKLKNFLKKWRQYPKKNHEAIARELELYFIEEQNYFWLPRGVIFRELCTKLWNQILKEEGFEQVDIPEKTEGKFFLLTEKRKFFYGINHIYLVCEKEELLTKSISSLQFIEKFIKLFDFDFQWIVAEKRGKQGANFLEQALQACRSSYLVEELAEQNKVEGLIADGLGRFCSSAQLKVEKGEVENKKILKCSFFNSVEQLISLVLERYEENLPFWLCPEQVRFFPLEGVDPNPIRKIFQELQIRFTEDKTEISLGEKIYRALRMKVPYVMVFGKREEKEGQIIIRTSSSNREESVSHKEMETILRGKQKIES